MMDPEAVKKYLTESAGYAVAALPARFFDVLVLNGIRLDLFEPGRILCSYVVPPRLSSSGNVLHGGVVATLVDVVGSAAIISSGLPTTGVSLDINVSYLDPAFTGEEIEMESKLLHAGKAVAVASVEFRNKRTGKLLAQGRHAKYLAASSKLWLDVLIALYSSPLQEQKEKSES
ncbi:Thioesterase superfamily [Musa troglodytarum]|uniref:Acyl-coenzyme A thioesterase 13 n=1 Tax=Musa troglodytarum TaxID=320322 RepID=A0A9E7LDE7_9LILI|nr:Thioesterase superfamily [Musa troglodytarum]